jgi:hypothetical protein
MLAGASAIFKVRETVFPDPATEGLGRQLQRFGREKARLLSDQRNEAVMRIDRGSPPCTSYFDRSTTLPGLRQPIGPT